MSTSKQIILEDSISIIERLAALCATPGINEDTHNIANEKIQELIHGPISTAIKELKTASAGIVTLK